MSVWVMIVIVGLAIHANDDIVNVNNGNNKQALKLRLPESGTWVLTNAFGQMVELDIKSVTRNAFGFDVYIDGVKNGKDLLGSIWHNWMFFQVPYTNGYGSYAARISKFETFATYLEIHTTVGNCVPFGVIDSKTGLPTDLCVFPVATVEQSVIGVMRKQ